MNIFNQVKGKKPNYNKFDLSHERKMSLPMGKLIPMFVSDVVPGDSFRVNSEIMLRFAPMLAPIMHRVNVFTHFFFVPNRLVWSEWEDFITGGRLGTANPVAPYITVNAANANFFNKNTLADYLGLPSGIGDDTDPINISALPFRAYQKIYDEYYRDQNLQADLDISTASGAVTGAELIKITELRNRAFEKDYFTSALPFAQRGGDVSLPVDSEATVSYKPISDVLRDDGTPEGVNTLLGIGPDDAGKLRSGKLNNTTTGWAARIENIANVIIDSTSVTINNLRRAIRLQEWLELTGRGGSRYTELMKAHFNVTSSDARLQRPEYLGGGKTPVVISEVLSTFQGETGNPQGNMAGHGFSLGGRNSFRKRFEEHGYIIGIMSVLPRTAYQQGIHRHWSRSDKFDYFWPSFANIGEQEIRNKEIYYTGNETAGNADGTFGYTPRYAEYKYIPSTVHGEFRDTLSFWHLGRIFGAPPSLNEDFVMADPQTMSRIFAVEAEEHQQLYCSIYNDVSALRPMPYFGTPTL